MKDWLHLIWMYIWDLVFPVRGEEALIRLLSSADLADLPRPAETLPHIQSIYAYRDPRVQALIWEAKYHRNSHARSLMALALAEEIQAELADLVLFENYHQAILVAAPCSRERLIERGFSHTHVLCQEITQQLTNVQYIPEALRKVRETHQQSWSKSRAERLRNLTHSCVANSRILKGKHLILIDDVTTTGATIKECTRALKAAGAKSVRAFTFAH